ncbi:MAG TPA: TonB-dependent receptor [Sphingomicrobium sp.]|nr:TonB-dependent receptor [Sphingomicrobium sp.]
MFVAEPVLADGASSSPPGSDLSNLSIEELAQIHVSSASKREEPLNTVPASMYVIDHDQIVRSGALTIPEMLRLAPNLQVYQRSPSNWVVTARGLNGDPDPQSFSNKLLVLVDGRTVYTPLFSGVYWDMPDLLPDDVERIEVISGPGATLWGANAVNGVINIITRSADATSGAYASVQAGTNEQVAGIRLAGLAAPQLAYRVYGRLISQDALDTPSGGSAHDRWKRLGAGFRLDWTPSKRDSVTLQGDIFNGRDDQPGALHEDISGDNLMLRWNRDMGDGQELQAQVYYDRIKRIDVPDNGSFFVDTYDIDLQHSFELGSRNQIVWGGGARVAHYRIEGTPALFFVPESRNLFLANLFLQDTFSVSDAVSLTAGIKAENDPYVGLSFLPDIRLALKPSKSTLLWAAVSHAVRSPTPFDEDVQEHLGTIVGLSGSRDFRTEKLTAYELGVRAQPISGLSLSATAFYHHYDDLRTVELGTGPATALNLYWGNGLTGHSYGVEAWASAKPLPWWTLSAGATLLREGFHFKTGASGIVGTFQNGVDPEHSLTARSSINLGSSVLFDLDVRAVGKLQHSGVPAYAELGGRLAWNVSDRLALSLTAANVLHARHVEYPGSDAISRKVLVGLQWRL